MADDRCDLLCSSRGPRPSAPRSTPWSRRLPPPAPKALGDPTRLLIALALREGDELCVCDLAWIAGRAENLVGHHLRLLRGAGLARSRRDGKIVFYALTDTGRTLVDAQLEAGAVV